MPSLLAPAAPDSDALAASAAEAWTALTTAERPAGGGATRRRSTVSLSIYCRVLQRRLGPSLTR